MKMIGKRIKTCRANLHGAGFCSCSNAHDSKGRLVEKRLAKRRERQQVKNLIAAELVADFDYIDAAEQAAQDALMADLLELEAQWFNEDRYWLGDDNRYDRYNDDEFYEDVLWLW